MNDMIFDRRALAMLDRRSGVSFLTGRAGTGKSTLIEHWRQSRSDRNIVMLAPTGIAALNVNGQTIHSFLHARPGVSVEQAGETGRRYRRDAFYRLIDALIIDEISMVRADLMDCLDAFLKAARSSRLPFGGVRLILVGDLLQLPPVVTRDDMDAFRTIWPGPWFFQARAMRPVFEGRDVGFTSHGLTVTHRQHDREFIRLLNALRDGSITQTGLDELNRRVRPAGEGIVLTGVNRTATVINTRHLEDLPGPEHVSVAVREGEWNPQLTPAPERLRLRDGMRVMMLANDRQGRWVNGSMGVLDHWDGRVAHIRLDDGTSVGTGTHSWQITRMRVTDRNGVKRLEPQVLGSYTQLPFTYGWAVTIHKSQGKSFEKVRLELPYDPLFAAGQAYVAYSRARTLDGLSVNRPLRASDVLVSPDALAFLNRMGSGFAQPPEQESLF